MNQPRLSKLEEGREGTALLPQLMPINGACKSSADIKTNKLGAAAGGGGEKSDKQLFRQIQRHNSVVWQKHNKTKQNKTTKVCLRIIEWP